MLTEEPKTIVAIIAGRGASRREVVLHRPHATAHISEDVQAGRTMLLAARAACGKRGTALVIRDVQYGPTRRCARCWSDWLPLADH